MSTYALVVDAVVANISTGDTAPDGWMEYGDDNPAFIGGPVIDGVFYPPQPFPSWTPAAGAWLPPVPRPEQGGPFDWAWDEDSQTWQDVSGI